jgi:predicted ATP-dependent serine protease
MLEDAALSVGLSRDEARHTIESGIAAGRKQPRFIPEKEFSSSYQRPNNQQTPPKQQTEQPKTENKPKGKLGKSGQVLMQKDFEPLRYCVDGIIPEGVTLLVGKSKIGKSAFALGVGASVATCSCSGT